MPPCKDCIVYPMCIGRLKKPTDYTNLMMTLYDECSIIQEYLKSDTQSTMKYSPFKVEKLVDYLNGE